MQTILQQPETNKIKLSVTPLDSVLQKPTIEKVVHKKQETSALLPHSSNQILTDGHPILLQTTANINLQQPCPYSNVIFARQTMKILEFNVFQDSLFLCKQAACALEEALANREQKIKPIHPRLRSQKDQSSFDSLNISSITLQYCLQRLLRYDVEIENILQGALIVHRMFELEGKNEYHLVTSYSIHRLLVTAIMVSCKFHSDQSLSFKDFAMVSGCTVFELKRQEIDYLAATNFEIWISPEAYRSYLTWLRAKHFKVVETVSTSASTSSPDSASTLALASTPTSASISISTQFITSVSASISTSSPASVSASTPASTSISVPASISACVSNEDVEMMDVVETISDTTSSIPLKCK
jgi:hypothetical protein